MDSESFWKRKSAECQGARVEPLIREGLIIGFTIFDPTASVIRHKSDMVDLLREQFPDISSQKLESASFYSEEYVAYVLLQEFWS